MSADAAIDLQIAAGLDAWANRHPNPETVVIAHSGRTYTPHDVAAAYRSGDDIVVRMVAHSVDHVGADNVALAFG